MGGSGDARAARRRRRALTAAAAGAAALAVVGVTAAGGAAGATGPAAHSAGRAPSAAKEYFGSVGGQAVYRYTLDDGHGMTVRILTYGGIIQSISAPDRHGREADVVLGFKTLDDYVTYNSPEAGGGVYFGAIVGRYANRIAKGTFTLDGKTYHVPVNNNGNSLHGGTTGFDKKVWSAQVTQGSGSVALKLTSVSPDGDNGYPGTLTSTVTYTLDGSGRLTADYRATTDAPTVVNLTNHTYWNLAGESSGSIDDQQLYLNADHYTPTDSTQIPTGQIATVKGTPMDFTRPTAIGARINSSDPQITTGQGYDLNWVLNGSAAGGKAPAAQAYDPESGRQLTIWTTQPGIQFYSGNFLTGTLVGISGHTYRQDAGFALETQHFPDSPNQPNFPSTVLNPGQVYHQSTTWQLSAH